MGGSAFRSGDKPLNTPRMPKDVYAAIQHRCVAVLKELYRCVASPVDGPDKQDFGDIDIVLASPIHEPSIPGARERIEAIAAALGAARVIVNENSSSNLALPWPAFEPAIDDAVKTAECAAECAAEEKYIQVDVKICKSPEEMGWFLFRHAHGDIWNILGSIISPYGLTATESALWLRVPEIEKSDKNRARIFLTSVPAQVLDFLGLPAERYWEQPFPDLDAMYEYVTRCPMFCVSALAQGDQPVGFNQLASSDRRRVKSRPAFRQWVDGFLAQCRTDGRFSQPRTSREQVRAEAFARFNVEAEYNSRRDAFLIEKQQQTISNELISGAIPEADKSDQVSVMRRACKVKALRRIILKGDESYGVLPGESFTDDDGFYLFENITDFIVRHGDEVAEAAWARQNERYVDHLRAKEAEADARIKTASISHLESTSWSGKPRSCDNNEERQ